MSAPKSSASREAEFMDSKAVQAHFGICETSIRKLNAAGTIKSILLRDRGKIRGKRLYVVDSIRDHLLSLIQSTK